MAATAREVDSVLEIKAVDEPLLPRLAELFGTDRTADKCWCVWYIRPVRDYHADGRAGNRRMFHELAHARPEPMGLLALRDGEPVGWCAAGPRARYARALRVPSLAGRDPAEDDTVWFVPCFFIRRGERTSGLGSALLREAVALARQWGAAAIEGFPFSGDRRRSGPDTQVGVERLFAGCGFVPVRRPSGSRVVMRRELR